MSKTYTDETKVNMKCTQLEASLSKTKVGIDHGSTEIDLDKIKVYIEVGPGKTEVNIGYDLVKG